MLRAMSGPLTFLVASPHLRGSFFEGAVILLLEHDAQGAMGLIINQPMPNPVSELLPDLRGDVSRPVWLGGPVDPSLGWCLYRKAVGLESEVELVRGLTVSSSLGVLHKVAELHEDYRLILGYAGWGAGQLTEEARDGTWLWVEEETARLIWDTPPEKCWQAALDTLGVNASTIVAGGAQA